MSTHGPARWEKLGQSTLTQTRIFDLQSVRYRHPGRAKEQAFVVLDSADWVNVLALTTDLRIVLVNQFRFGAADFSLEIPGGIMDVGEDPVTAGLRELREETGYSGTEARLLGSVHPNPAIQSNRCHYVLVTGVEKSHAFEWDDDEEIEVTLQPVDDVLALARRGGITHALVLNALFLFEPWWRERRDAATR